MMSLPLSLGAAGALLLTAVGAQAAVTTQSFSSSAVVCTTSAMVNPVGCSWFGAQHGVSGPSGVATWNSGMGSDGSAGFVGYSPSTRAGVTLFTNGFGTLSLADITSVGIDARNTDGDPTGQASGNVRLALRETDGDWHVSDFGYAPDDDVWTTLVFGSLQSLTFRLHSTNGVLPNQPIAASSLLAANAQIDGIGFFTSWSGQNDPNRGFVLRYDNFALDVNRVPEPASLALAGLALAAAAGATRRRRPAR